MPNCTVRLTVLGARTTLLRFIRSDWDKALEAQFIEPWEMMKKRRTWIFSTNSAPVDGIQSLSCRWPTLTFLLDYEWESRQVKGIARAKAGKTEQHKLKY